MDIDYENWVAHFDNSDDDDYAGCLLGLKEPFSRLKKDSWSVHALLIIFALSDLYALTKTHCIVLNSPFVLIRNGTLVNTGPL